MSNIEAQEFRPEMIPRRGEVIAWVMTFFASLGMWLLSRTGYVVVWLWLTCVCLLFSALSISLGNWMDRKTMLQVASNGIRFENGLRRVQLRWQEVQMVAVLPSRWGKIVRVVGDTSHFRFKTLGEFHFQGKVHGRTGFSEGQAILDIILRESSLELAEKNGMALYYSPS